MTDTEKNIDRIIDEAAEWFVLIDAGDASDKEKANFAEWLNASPLHAREYAEISGLWDEAALYGAELTPDPAVIQLYPAPPSPRQNSEISAPFWREWRKMAAALLVGILLASAVGYFGAQEAPSDQIANLDKYDTAKGESRRVRLDDGSFVQLNTDSAIEVSFTEGFRELTLLQGEAFFEVAPNPMRPFIVAVDTTRVQVVGTQFNVNKRREKIEVTVLEGKVRVSEQPPAQTEKWLADLTKGEQVVTLPLSVDSRTTITKPFFQKQDHLNLQAVLSWRDNKLTFDNRDLKDVVEDFNRYNDLALVLADDALNHIKVSGTFNPTDPESFAKSIESIAHIRAEVTPDGRILFHKEPE